ncbi:MAG: GGDEF domain-containing protein [Aquabacterium sp.]|uniref:GGDEF domain-containing protein n=1 Tax=Aquabacterium sp. TaxID=1872578 RepID=UPI003BDA3DA3
MQSTDIFTCYSISGGGSLVGLGLMSLLRTRQPRVREAVSLYRLAFACLSALLLIQFCPEEWQRPISQFAIGLAVSGVTLLAWAFRQLNGRQTTPLAGWGITGLLTLGLWLAAWTGSDGLFTQAIALAFAFISLWLLFDQGWLILRSPRVARSEMSLLIVAAAFAANWLISLWYATNREGPYPEHWLYAPTWLLPFTGLSFALLPLAVAALVFAIINERLNQQLRARSLSDDLTGALSRRGLRELGQRMLSMLPAEGNPVAVMMIDIDRFRAINHQYGHEVGDEVLREVTQIVRDTLRFDALLARYGGEELTAMLSVKSRLEGRSLAESVRQAIENTPCRTAGGPIKVTASIGLSFLRADGSLEDALARADVRMHEAKRDGRNRVGASELTMGVPAPTTII